MPHDSRAAPQHALVVGEALIDIVERRGERAELVGGSPANLAVGLARLGHPTRLLTRIGRDARGERIAALLADEGVRLLPDSWDAQPTSTARARISADGSAEYVFAIDGRFPAHAPEPAALVHAGSIALFLEPGGSRVLELLEGAAGTSLVTLDPNIRPALLPDRAAAVRRFEEAARTADLVKLSDEDAAWLYPDVSPERAAARVRDLGPRFVVVTLGARGAFALDDDVVARVAARTVEVVDTIGAGDSFMASLASSLLEHREGADSAWGAAAGAAVGSGAHLARPEPFDVRAALDRAARAAAIAVSSAGANPPRRAQLDA